MSKQDRQGVRTPADIERKYNFGEYKKSFDEVRKAQASVVQMEEDLRKDFSAELEGYAKKTDLRAYAKTGDLDDYVLQDYYQVDRDDIFDSINAMSEEVNRVSIDTQGVITDVYDHFEFGDGGTRIKGIFKAMMLPEGTDLDGVILPNKYVGGSVLEYGYENTPIEAGPFLLEVESCGDSGQLLQRYIYSHKTNGKTFERVFDRDSWGEWVCVIDYAGASFSAMQTELDVLTASFNEHRSATETMATATADDIDELGDDLATINQRTQALSADLQGVITDINDHFDFNEGGMTIKGAINPMLIPAGTDLNGLTIPNKYIGGTVTEYKYLNCPVTSGTFLLEVDSCGIEGQLRQRITYCHKTNGKTWERYSYGVDWGAWILAHDYTAETVAELRADVEADINALTTKHNTLNTSVNSLSTKLNNLFTQTFLWSGQNYMTATQTVELSGKVSEQRNGIVLVFCEYLNGAAATSAFHSFFIPKEQVVTHPAKGYTFTLATGKFEYMATKYLYIDDQVITGHADNNATGTGTSGIKYTNNRFVLRYVIGV